jgi:hypothetical protein
MGIKAYSIKENRPLSIRRNIVEFRKLSPCQVDHIKTLTDSEKTEIIELYNAMFINLEEILMTE